MLAGRPSCFPWFTTRAEPLLEAAGKLLTGYLTEHWPHLSTRDVRLVAESAIRLTVSHLVLPLAPIERTADDLATLVERLLPPELHSTPHRNDASPDARSAHDDA